MHPIIRLVNRNLTISINPGFLIWQVIFPLIYIFVAGYAYTSLIEEVPFGNKSIDYPVFFESIEFTVITIPMIIFAAIVGSVLFGSIASIISTRLRSSEGFNVIINTVFLFLAFVSTAFYPALGSPEPLRTAFYLNPLTYLVDVIRAGIFGNITEFVIMEMGILVVIASLLFIIATKLLTKLDF